MASTGRFHLQVVVIIPDANTDNCLAAPAIFIAPPAPPPPPPRPRISAPVRDLLSQGAAHLIDNPFARADFRSRRFLPSTTLATELAQGNPAGGALPSAVLRFGVPFSLNRRGLCLLLPAHFNSQIHMGLHRISAGLVSD